VLIANAEQAMIIPVLAGLAAMVAVAVLGGWLQGRRWRTPRRVELEPRAPHDLPVHVHPRDHVYDWARHDCWPAR
jgi:hypothetical protein